MNRLTSYGFVFALIYLAILEGNAEDHVMLIQGFVLSVLLAYSAFFLTWLTLDATVPVIIVGTAVLGFGGWILAVALIVFFVTGSLFSRLNIHHTVKLNELMRQESRRDGQQVWANGFWVVLYSIAFFLFPGEYLLGAAFGVIATATADTWATETGIRSRGKTIDLRTRSVVEPGTDGGVSFRGTLFSLFGALLMGFFASQGLRSEPLVVFACVSMAGFLGCLIDSYIGAVFQQEQSDSSGSYWSSLDRDKQNSLVNWISTGSGGFIAMLLLLIF